jgi:hypothetical protein
MVKQCFFAILLFAFPLHAQTWSSMNVDALISMNTSTPGTTLTNAIANAGMVSSQCIVGLTCSFNGVADFEVGPNQPGCSNLGAVQMTGIGGATYAAQTLNYNSMAHNDANNNSNAYMYLIGPPAVSTVVAATACITLGPPAQLDGSDWDIMGLWGLLGSYGEAQVNAYCPNEGDYGIRIEEKTSSGAIIHSSCIGIAPQGTYWVALVDDFSSGSTYMWVYTAQGSLIGNTSVTGGLSGDSVYYLQLGNNESGNNPGTFTYFQNVMLNWTSASVSAPLFWPDTPLQFIPVTPCRVADTRNATGPFGGPELAANTSRAFNIPQSACDIPTTAVAYSMNVTVVPSGTLRYLTMWPTGQAQPLVSLLNSNGRVKANAAIVGAGTKGGVSVYATDATQVILDIDGYFVPAGTASAALSFYPLPPCRIADTRNVTGPLGGPSLSANSSRAFPVQSSSCNIPSTAQAYSLNVTAVPHGALGYLTAWPTGQSQPLVSTLNAPTGAVTANAAIVPAGNGGEISLFVTNTADVVLDVNGYFAPPATGGLSLYTVAPCRVIDTRTATGAFIGVLAVNVEGSTCAPPATAQAYVLNATVVPSGKLGYLTLWPAGEPLPLISTLNAGDGAITSNMAVVLPTNGIIDAFSTNPTNLVLDLSSYFAP